MTKEEHIKYWIESAEYDLATSQNLLTIGRYNWALFIGHLALEKLLKAIFVDANNNKIPPKIHNLVKLAELSSLKLDDSKIILLDKINDFNIEARYPEYKNQFYKTCTKDYAEEYFNKINEMFIWIKSHLK